MELESFVFSLSVVLEVIGVAGIFLCGLCKNRRITMHAEIAMIGCLCGLGSTTILGVLLRAATGLFSGVALVAIGVALIFLVDRHVDDCPHAASD